MSLNKMFKVSKCRQAVFLDLKGKFTFLFSLVSVSSGGLKLICRHLFYKLRSILQNMLPNALSNSCIFLLKSMV